jgi:hypothetical protein
MQLMVAATNQKVLYKKRYKKKKEKESCIKQVDYTVCINNFLKYKS